MTTDEFIAKQKKIFQQIIQKDVPLQKAAQSTLAMQATRIFEDGKNSAGSNIGSYNSSNPLYVNPKTSAGAASKGLGVPRGKTGQTKFKSGKPHKTVWIQSYKAYKGRIGQKNDKVRLVLSGDLQSDFKSSQLVKNSVHEYTSGVKRDINVKKAGGLQDKYGSIFALTKAETDNFFTRAQQEYDLIIANA